MGSDLVILYYINLFVIIEGNIVGALGGGIVGNVLLYIVIVEIIGG